MINGIVNRCILLLFCFAMSNQALAQRTDLDTLPPCQPCEAFLNLKFPEVRITKAESLEEPVAHCKVSGVIGKEINFEVVLPDQWNQRFTMSGNGGFAGSIQTSHYRVKQGFANAATDTGHKGKSSEGSWAHNDMERQVNFGHLAVHRTTEVAKAIIEVYYCKPPAYNYFVGCSRGGGQAMMSAQRYPEDFDGIVAGAPAFDWTALAAEFVQNCQVAFPDPDNLDIHTFSPALLELLEEAVLSQCDGLDGVEDEIMTDPRDCNFDYTQLPVCEQGEAGQSTCFTQQQIEAIKTIYSATSVNGKEVYPGFPFGGEGRRKGWPSWITGFDTPGSTSSQFKFGTQVFRYFVYNDPEWDYSTYTFDDYFERRELTSSFLDATSTDYGAFTEREGKMIMYHGWSDPALSALSTIKHYETARSQNASIKDHIRLFLLPGVLHCGGGPGPSRTNWLQLVQEWVENGQAPNEVIVKKGGKNGNRMERPVYPYPSKAVYDGKGDPNQASSFSKD